MGAGSSRAPRHQHTTGLKTGETDSSIKFVSCQRKINEFVNSAQRPHWQLMPAHAGLIGGDALGRRSVIVRRSSLNENLIVDYQFNKR